MSVNIREADVVDDDSLSCASCDTREIAIVIEADNFRLAMCEHCFKEFVNEATSMSLQRNSLGNLSASSLTKTEECFAIFGNGGKTKKNMRILLTMEK